MVTGAMRRFACDRRRLPGRERYRRCRRATPRLPAATAALDADPGRVGCVDHRRVDRERAALAARALHVYRAADVRDNRADEREPEARATTQFLGREERRSLGCVRRTRESWCVTEMWPRLSLQLVTIPELSNPIPLGPREVTFSSAIHRSTKPQSSSTMSFTP